MGYAYGPITIGSSNQYDEDALMFCFTAGVADEAVRDGINTFVKNLKANSLWNLFYAIYPFTGHADGCKYNLKDLQKHKVDFGSSVELLSSGVRFNTGAGNLNFSAADMESQDISAHFYIKENASASTQDLGQQPTMADPNRLGMHVFLNAQTYFDLGNLSAGRLTASADGTGGLVSGNRLGDVQSIYKNGILKASKTNALNIAPSSVVINTIGGNNPRIFSFFALGKGFADAQMALLYTEVQQLMTALGRNV